MFLTSVLAGGEWSASRFGPFTLEERVPGTHRTGGCVGLLRRPGRRGENSWPYWVSNSDPSVVQPIVNRYTDCATPAPFRYAYSSFGVLSKQREGLPKLRKSLFMTIILSTHILDYYNLTNILTGQNKFLAFLATEFVRESIHGRSAVA
jgi:hypothetical protein